jgi:hypothetical protein
MKTISAILSVLTLTVASHISATEAIFMYQATGPNIVGYAFGGAGFAFVPSTTLSVTSLGFGGSDLATTPYQVTLWNSGGTQLATTTVTTGSPFLNQTYYGAVSPVILSAGQTYYLGALETGTNGLWVGDALVLPPDPSSNGTITVSPDISYVGGALGMANNGGIPTSITSVAFYINANFQYTVVPEPSLFGFMTVGLGGLVLVRRKFHPRA